MEPLTMHSIFWFYGFNFVVRVLLERKKSTSMASLEIQSCLLGTLSALFNDVLKSIE